jgi:prophage DNA circulation protein
MTSLQNKDWAPPWRKALVPASFRGAVFHVETGSHATGRRVALHEYPKRDTPYAEDMGRRAKRFRIEGYVIGPNYKTGRDALMQACEQEGGGALIHPTMGTLQVICEAINTTETREWGGYCIFDLSFVEVGSPGNAGTNIDTAAQSGSAADSNSTTAASSADTGLGADTATAQAKAQDALNAANTTTPSGLQAVAQ